MNLYSCFSYQSLSSHRKCRDGICIEIDCLRWWLELCVRLLCAAAQQNRRGENFLHEKCESIGSVAFVPRLIAMGTGSVPGGNLGAATNTIDCPRICTAAGVHVSDGGFSLPLIQIQISLRISSGKYSEALMNYERGLTAASSDDHVRQCQFGIARTNIKIGDYKKGVRNSK